MTGLRVQACGDAHVANFGKFATPERNLVFDLNDFDETLPGPWEWDVKRLAASMLGGRAAARILDDPVRTDRDHDGSRVPRARGRSGRDGNARTLVRQDDGQGRHCALPGSLSRTDRRDVVKARRKDHRRAAAKLTHGVEGKVGFVEDPPLVVHLDNTGHDMDDVQAMITSYRQTLTHDMRSLFDRFRIADVARKVVGVGSVGTRCWICLFEGPDHPEGDRIILQVKEAQASVLEPYVGASRLGHHGHRVVAGQRVTQAASDIFLGWTEAPGTGRQYYVRQLWDFKGSSDPMTMDFANLSYYGALCAMALARAHARTGDPVEIAGYLGSSDVFDRAIAAWAARYALTNEADHAALVDAVAAGRVPA